MMHRIRTTSVVLAAMFVVTTFAFAQDVKKSGKRKARRRTNPAFATVKDDPALPRVLLIGDSISIGYTLDTRALLRGKANVHRIPTNGGPTTRGVESLKQWLGESHWDLIHFNWGLHDLKFMPDGKRQVPIDRYEQNIRELVSRLKATNARLIWASTTPVPSGKLSPPRTNDDVIAYNAVAAAVMKEHDVTINDLYAFALPKFDELQRPANVHFTPSGSKKLAEQVARSVRAVLAR